MKKANSLLFALLSSFAMYPGAYGDQPLSTEPVLEKNLNNMKEKPPYQKTPSQEIISFPQYKPVDSKLPDIKGGTDQSHSKLRQKRELCHKLKIPLPAPKPDHRVYPEVPSPSTIQNTSIPHVIVSDSHAEGSSQGLGYIMRGVNLGGWLLTEPWITPSLFKGMDQSVNDEYTLCAHLKNKCKEKLKQHWDTFVTEATFAKIKAANLNTVRVPFGYWAFNKVEGEPYVDGQIPYIEKTIEWARKYQLKVMLDLHGAFGSQNGFDNSGRKTDDPLWGKDQNLRDQTIDVLVKIMNHFKSHFDVVTSIEILNEPHGGKFDLSVINEFYQEAYKKLRMIDQRPRLFFGDGFFPQNWTHISEKNDYKNVGIDSHFYHVFDRGLMFADKEARKKVICKDRKEQLAFGENKVPYTVPHIVGEWSGALTDCAEYLNGVGEGTRWEQTFKGPSDHEDPGTKKLPARPCKDKENSDTWTEEYKTEVREFIEYQMSVYESMGGWIFWNFKSENADSWNYLKGVEKGYIPKNPSKLEFSCKRLVESSSKDSRNLLAQPEGTPVQVAGNDVPVSAMPELEPVKSEAQS